jgi:hypothetical protein
MVVVCLVIGSIFLINVNSKSKYEVNDFTYNTTEYADYLQFDMHIETTNLSDEIAYLTIDFSPYIFTNIETPPAPIKLNPNSSTTYSTVISVRKNGA